MAGCRFAVLIDAYLYFLRKKEKKRRRSKTRDSTADYSRLVSGSSMRDEQD